VRSKVFRIGVFVVVGAIAIYALWLARNQSGAIQATALATLALCIITGWYAILTHKLVAHTQGQSKQLKRSELEHQHSETMVLSNLADRVGAALRELPADTGEEGFDAKIREGALWSREDLRELEILSARLGPWASVPLSQVTNFMLWMEARILEVQRVDPRSGFDYRQFPGDKWKHAWEESSRQLAVISKLADDEAERLAGERRKLDESIGAA